MPIKYGTFIISVNQLNSTFKYCFDHKIKSIYIFTDFPTEVECEFAYVDKKINEYDLSYSPSLTMITQYDEKMLDFLRKSDDYILIVYRPFLNKTFLKYFSELIDNSKEKCCCLFLLLDMPLTGSWRTRFNKIPKVYFQS